MPPQLTFWHAVWLPALHVNVPPPSHVPAAPFTPHPLHTLPTIFVFTSAHVSVPPHDPDTV